MEFFSNLGDWPLSKKGRGDKFPIFSWCGSDDTTDFVMPTYDLTESTLESMSRFVSRQLPLLLFLVQIYQIELSKMILSLSKILHWLTWKLEKKKKKKIFCLWKVDVWTKSAVDYSTSLCHLPLTHSSSLPLTHLI